MALSIAGKIFTHGRFGGPRDAISPFGPRRFSQDWHVGLMPNLVSIKVLCRPNNSLKSFYMAALLVRKRDYPKTHLKLKISQSSLQSKIVLDFD